MSPLLCNHGDGHHGAFNMSTGASYGDQMTKKWIAYCAKKFLERANGELKPLATKVFELFSKGQYSKTGVTFRDQVVAGAPSGNIELLLINLAK